MWQKIWQVTKELLQLLQLTQKAFGAVRAGRLAASLAFYTILSLSPLLIVAVSLTKSTLGRDDVRAFILLQVESLLGPQASETIGPIIQTASENDGSVGLTIFGIAILIFSASGMFTQLVDILNQIWRVQIPQRPFLQVLKERLTGFIMVLLAGMILVLLFFLNTSLTAFARFAPDSWVFAQIDWLSWVRTGLTGFVLVLIFGLVFRVLPDAYVAWRDVWVGAIITGVLFTIGLHAVGWYLSYSSIGSAYGAAGSLLVTLLAIYYAAQIFLFGAQFTHVFSLSRFGSSHAHENAPPSPVLGPRRRRRRRRPKESAPAKSSLPRWPSRE